jgi:hypothetical protein
MHAHSNTCRLIHEDQNNVPTWNLLPAEILSLPASCALTLALEINLHPATPEVFLTCMRALLVSNNYLSVG